MTRQRALVLLSFGAVTVALAILLFFSDAARAAVLDPLLHLLHLFRFYFTRLSQSLIWFAFIAAGAAIWLRELYRSLPAVDPPRRPALAADEESLTLTVRALHRASYSRLARAQLSRRLAEIAARAAAQRRGIRVEDARAEIANRQWPSDPDVAAFLTPRHSSPDTRQQFAERLDRTLSYLEQYRQEV